MRNWLFSILVLCWAGLATAGDLVFPPAFEGMTITDNMLSQSPAKDGWVLVSFEVTVPEGATPLNGFREDMWSKGQLQVDKVLAGASTLTPEQAYKALFCQLNKEAQGYTCKSTAEVAQASVRVPWVIPIVVMPAEQVMEFTAFITSAGPIPASATRVVGSQGDGSTQADRNAQLGALIPWSDAPRGAPVAPPDMQWFEGPVPEHLRADLQKPKTTKQANAGPIRAKKPGPGGPPTKDRTQ